MRFAKALQSRRFDAIYKPQEPCLHIRRKRRDLCSDRFV